MEIVELFKNHPYLPAPSERMGRTDGGGCYRVDRRYPLSFALSLPPFYSFSTAIFATSLSYLLTEENLAFLPPFFTFGAPYILTLSVSSIRFSSWRIVSRYHGENLESKSPVRLMVNGLETIYPFSSRARARAASPIGATKRFSLSARAKPSARYLSCKRALLGVM